MAAGHLLCGIILSRPFCALNCLFFFPRRCPFYNVLSATPTFTSLISIRFIFFFSYITPSSLFQYNNITIIRPRLVQQRRLLRDAEYGNKQRLILHLGTATYQMVTRERHKEFPSPKPCKKKKFCSRRSKFWNFTFVDFAQCSWNSLYSI